MQANLFENTSGLKALLEKVDRLKAELDAMRPLNADQEARVMQKFRLDWNYHSNSIEGNSLTYGETIAFLMEGLTAKGKPFKDHLDIKGHNEAINYLIDMVKNRQQLSEKVIRELHEIILVEPYKTPALTTDGRIVEKQVTLGAYKKMPNHVKTPTGEIHYYATPEETPAKMSDLMAWLRDHQEKEDLNPLIVAAVFHYQFVAIHPFDDGNGRMSRLLMNLFFLQYLYPPVVIKQQERNLYYNALRQADAGDLGAFVEFIGENLVHSLEIYLRGAKGESIEEQDDLDKEIALLKASLGGNDEATPKDRETVIKLITNVFLPVFQAIQVQCKKVDDLFLEGDGKLVWGERSDEELLTREFRNTDSPHYTPREISDFKSHWSRFVGNRGLLVLNPFQFNFEYNWKGFKKTRQPFSIHKYIGVNFQNFNYEVEFNGTYEKIKISNLYNQELTQEEIKRISNIFLKEALAEIKAHTQK